MKPSIVFSPPKEDSFYILQDDGGYGNDKAILTPFESESSNIELIGSIQSYDLNNGWFLDFLPEKQIVSTSYSEYAKAFETAKSEIHKNNISKVILSKREVKPFSRIDIDVLLQKLLKEYPNAFIYAFYDGNEQFWIGATPELLIKKELQKAETVALAGTKKDKGIPWSAKEYEEQAIVRRYLEDQLKSLELEFDVLPQETIQSGTLYHLQNTFQIHLEDNKDLSQIVNALHPTPAISGLPKAKSIKLIAKIEASSRDLYCGTIGIVQNDEHDYYVNLRCARVYQNCIEAYAGGGITADSEVKKEWEECGLKAQAILKFL